MRSLPPEKVLFTSKDSLCIKYQQYEGSKTDFLHTDILLCGAHFMNEVGVFLQWGGGRRVEGVLHCVNAGMVPARLHQSYSRLISNVVVRHIQLLKA